jgi:large repetitive protein
MLKFLLKTSILSLVFLFFIQKTYAQCTGSLGDPVTKINFGAGATNPGSALATGITNYPFVTAACPNDGFYTVRNSTSGCFSSWHTLTEDHTPGDANGQMMIVNAANTAGEFYKQTISGLCPGTGYELSAYVVNLLRSTACTSNPNRFPKLTFQIESTSGTILGTFNTPNVPTLIGTSDITPSQWSRYALFFTSNASTVVLKIINNAPGGCGNDLALDDIEFRPCGPTLLSTITGTTTVCVGNTVAINSTLAAGYTNPQFQWQSSTDNVTFTNIAGATSTSLVRTPTVGITYYRLLSSENGNIGNANCRIVSNVTAITTNAIPSAPTATGTQYCQNAAATALVATGTGTLKWYGTNASGGGSTASQTPSTTAAGTLNYYVSNTVNACESPRTAVPVVINPVPSITATVGNISCNGVATGTITSAASGGTPAFTFSKDGVNFAAGNVFSALAAGTYTITVKDSKNCIGTTSITLASSNPLSLTTEVINTCAVGNNGQVTANGAGGTGALEYAIDAGAFSATNVFTGLTPGNHTVKLQDSSTPTKCGIEIIVNVPTVINPTVSAVVASACITGNTGSVIATPSNGSVAFQYALSGGAFQNGNVFPNLGPGTYTVTLKDNRSCISNATAVTINTIPAPPAVVTPAPFCANSVPNPLSATGALVLWYTAASGGVGSPTQPVVNTAVAGSQTYYVSQTLNGCESPRTELTVNISPAVTISLSKIDACNGIANGSVSAVVSGGVSPFVFNLNGGAAVGSSFFENLAGGNSYSVWVTDANGCTATATITVNTGPALSVTATTGGDCIELGAGSITPVGVGGSGAYTYKLNSGAYTNAVPFTGLNAGTFTICVKDAQGCLGFTSVTIKPKPLVVASSNSPTCNVAGSPIIALEGLEAGPTAIYNWTGPNGFVSSLQNPTLPFVKSSGATEGNYILNVTLDGCTANSTVAVTCAGSALPVKLSTFGASQIENTILVNWASREDVNFDRFELEKSKDIKSFEKIYTTSIPNDDKDQHVFNFKDFEPETGLNYYRLKMIDKDGSVNYSKIIGVNFDKNGEYVSIENPVKANEFQVFTNIKDPKISLYNLNGQKVKYSVTKTDNGFSVKTHFTSSVLLFNIKGEKLNKTLRLLGE